jgi:hypothetical protein
LKNSKEKYTAFQLFKHSRLWVFEQNDSFSDLEYAMNESKGHNDKYPIEIHGRILLDHQLIDEINVADDETILLEWQINNERERSDLKAWAFDPKSKKNKKSLSRSRLSEKIQEIDP